MTKKIHILGGGTISHVLSHLALCTPAYGTTAKEIREKCVDYMLENSYIFEDYVTTLHLTKMADPTSSLQTNEDVEELVNQITNDEETKIVFFNVALTDYSGSIDGKSGKYERRLKTKDGDQTIHISPQKKLLKTIREKRKDIFLVAFKTTCGATEDEQYISGCNLLKKNSCNLVLANDVKTRKNMIITPEQARYCTTTDRNLVLQELVEMALKRSQLTFTRSTVLEGESVGWNSDDVPTALREVVNHCIQQGAYKPFNGTTVGHFAVKVNDTTFLTSKRKANYNDLDTVGLVKVESTGPDSVIAYGAKPSVGGMSQRMIFDAHKDLDSIVHFHCPMKEGSNLSVKQQKYFECGSHECGQNTLNGLKDEGDIKVVYLDNHGPNIVFNSNTVNPKDVISFIDNNFDLSKSTDQIDRTQNVVL